MGIRDLGKRLATPNKEIDAERLRARFNEFEITKLSHPLLRTRSRIAGEIKRMRIKPRSGIPAVEIVISDGTGEATIIFSGRRSIPGVDHGQSIMIDGVPHFDGHRVVVINPAYTLLA